jgi:glycolate oxidase
MLKDLQRILGDRVSNSSAQLYCYSTDASQVQGMPDYVARPLSTEEVSKILILADRHEVPVTPRGAGTGLAGGAVPTSGGIVLDMSGMNRIIDLDTPNLQVLVEPGVVLDRLNEKLHPLGFFFPIDPGSSAMCTLGGLISNNGSGMRSVKYGTPRSYVLDLEVVLSDGRVIRTGSKMLKSSAGYDLTRLFIGAEGTLGVITQARVRIVPLPKARRLLLASFPSADVAGDAVVETFSRGVVPSACEIMDRTTVKVLRSCYPQQALPDGDILLFEVDGTRASVDEEVGLILEACSNLASSIKAASSKREMEEIWTSRRLVGAAVSRLDPSKTRVYVGEDVGVPLSQVPALIRKVEEISLKYDIPAMKFGHIGDGNLHVALFIDVMDADQWQRLERTADEIHRAALALGGTVSCEHGIGLAKASYMKDQIGDSLEVMRAIKRALDPKGILNPGKLGL